LEITWKSYLDFQLFLLIFGIAGFLLMVIYQMIKNKTCEENPNLDMAACTALVEKYMPIYWIGFILALLESIFFEISNGVLLLHSFFFELNKDILDEIKSKNQTANIDINDIL
jgi:uncharacterized sodium:solute symporter family permease YidK